MIFNQVNKNSGNVNTVVSGRTSTKLTRLKKLNHYYVQLIPDDDGFSAIVLNLPGAASQGNTAAEALRNATEAIEGCVAQYEADEQPIPWKDISFEKLQIGAICTLIM